MTDFSIFQVGNYACYSSLKNLFFAIWWRSFIYIGTFLIEKVICGVKTGYKNSNTKTKINYGQITIFDVKLIRLGLGLE